MPWARVWWALWAAVGWTAFVWIGRIRNALADDALDVGDLRRALVLSAVSLVAAAPVLPLWARVRSTGAAPAILVRLVVANLVVSVAIWVPRVVFIVVGGHDIGFVVVHLVLAVVSVGLWTVTLVTRPVEVNEGHPASAPVGMGRD